MFYMLSVSGDGPEFEDRWAMELNDDGDVKVQLWKKNCDPHTSVVLPEDAILRAARMIRFLKNELR